MPRNVFRDPPPEEKPDNSKNQPDTPQPENPPFPAEDRTPETSAPNADASSSQVAVASVAEATPDIPDATDSRHPDDGGDTASEDEARWAPGTMVSDAAPDGAVEIDTEDEERAVDAEEDVAVPSLEADDLQDESNADDLSEDQFEDRLGEASRNVYSAEYDKFREEEQRRARTRRSEQNQVNWLEFGFMRQEVLKKNEEVFVDTDEMRTFLDLLAYDERADNHIFIVSGPPESGRYAAAIRIARELAQDIEIREHTPDITTQSLSLFELISRIYDQRHQSATEPNTGEGSRLAETQFAENAVIIVEDAFGHIKSGQRIPELTGRYTRQFKILLGDIRLVLTTDIRPTDYPDMTSNYLVVRTTDSEGYGLVDLGAVYERHIDYYFPQAFRYYTAMREILLDIKVEVLQRLRAPVDIDRYLDSITRDVPEDAQTALALADQVLEERSNIAVIQRWFNEELEPFNKKLYVIFAAFFDGLNRYQLDDFYDEAVRELRASAPDQFEDPRYISARTMLNDIHMKEQSNQTLAFIHNREAYERVILEQAHDYYRLLWDLSGLFVRKIEQSRPADRRLRRLLATVLGRVGVLRRDELQDILTAMTENPHAHVAEAVTYTLVEIANDVDHHDFVLKILQNWLDSHQFQRMLSAIGGLASVFKKLVEHFPFAVEIVNDEVDSTQINKLDSNRIAAQTMRKLGKLLETYCHELGNVDMEPVERELEEIRPELEAEILKAFLEDQFLAHVWRSEHEGLKQALREAVAEEADKKTEELRMLAYIEYTDQLTLAVVYRIGDITHVIPQQMVEMLREWLETPQTITHDIARLAINRLFIRSAEQEPVVVGENELALLALLPYILEASEDISSNVVQLLVSGAFREDMSALGGGLAREEIERLVRKRPINLTMEALDKWYQYFEESELALAAEATENPWRDVIYPRLLDTVNGATQSTRTILAESLIASWLNSSHVDVRRSAMALLTRAYVLNGAVLDLPLSRYGVVMIDQGQIEPRSAYDQYIDAVFRLSQRLATLAPLRLYHMGYAPSNMKPLRIGSFDLAESTVDTVRAADLTSPQATAPKSLLIMPFISPLDDHIQPLDPQECHYVLLLNMQPVLDWSDVLSEAIQIHQDQASDTDQITNIFKDSPETNDILSIADERWVWHGKFIFNKQEQTTMYFEEMDVLPPHTYRTYRASTNNLFSVGDAIEAHLQHTLIANLHHLDRSQWLADLNQYHRTHLLGQGEGIPPLLTLEDPAEFMRVLASWPERLNTVYESISTGDLTLALMSGVLLLSLIDLDRAVQLAVSWLEDERAEHVLMGRTATKQLFNFYGVPGNESTAATHGSLLRLLPPFVRLPATYADLRSIIFILLKWAEDAIWSERLLQQPNGQPSELVIALGNLEDQDDIDQLVAELEFRAALWRIQALVLRLSTERNQRIRSMSDFVDLLNELIEWVRTEKQRLERLQALTTDERRMARRAGSRRQRRTADSQAQIEALRHPKRLPQGITEDIALELLELPGLTEQNQKRILHDINDQQQQFFQDVAFRRQHPQRMNNLKRVMGSMRLQLFSKHYELPPLESDNGYVVVFVDATTRYERYREQAGEIVLEFLKELMKHPEAHQVVPVVHRLGRSEAIYTQQPQEGKRARVQLELDTITAASLNHEFVTLIGPALARYPSTDVAFVFIVTASAVWDLADWAKQSDWPAPLYRHRIGQVNPAVEQTEIEDIFNTTLLSNADAGGGRPLMPSAVERMMARRHRRKVIPVGHQTENSTNG